jgi:hypothetical protein
MLVIDFPCAAEIVMLKKVMSRDAALAAFTSLGFVSIFLAFIVGMTGNDPADLVSGIANMTPTARRQAQFEQLNYTTQVAMKQSRRADVESARHFLRMATEY